jgi:hypothetical protein
MNCPLSVRLYPPLHIILDFNVMIRRICIITLALTLLYGCSKVFQPDINTVEPYLTVEGFISTEPGYNYVYLSNSQSYNDEAYFRGLSGATVTVTDNQGKTYTYNQASKGIYRINLQEGNTAVVGRTYTLSVITAEGDTYESLPQQIVQSSPITNVFCQYHLETVLTEDTYGQPLEMTYDGINVLASTDGILPSDNFYLYAWHAYEEHHAVLGEIAGISTYYIYRHRPLSGKYVNIIRTGDADAYDNFHLRNKNVVFIRRNDMTDYDPSFNDTIYTLLGNYFDGLIFQLEQNSLSADAYSFYHDIENQLDAEGRLFDPVSPQIAGNIHCVNDESKKVIGVFYASDVAKQVAYFYINSRNQIYSKELDALPQLWLDTCSWSFPDDWILPPY